MKSQLTSHSVSLNVQYMAIHVEMTLYLFSFAAFDLEPFDNLMQNNQYPYWSMVYYYAAVSVQGYLP